MMSIERSELGANIRNYIELNKALQIDGVGTLVKTSFNCSLNKESHFIFPGQDKIVLQANSHQSSAEFISFLSNKLNISGELALSKFNTFCENLVNDLAIDGKSTVYDLGQFSSNQNKLAFRDFTNSNVGEFYGLPVLELRSTSTLDRSLPKKKTKKRREVPIRDKADQNFLVNVAAIAAMFILAIFAYHNYNDVNEPAITSFEIDKSRLNQDPESLLVSDELKADLIPGIIEKEKEVASCALIIGSFARKSNAIELQSKVLAAGFDLYTEEFHEFYRVGISLDCSDINGAKFAAVEEALGVDPWLRIVR